MKYGYFDDGFFHFWEDGNWDRCLKKGIPELKEVSLKELPDEMYESLCMKDFSFGSYAFYRW
jgi:hypothetical protein